MLSLFAAETAETTTNNPILPVLPEIFWGGLMFALLYLLMRYVLLPPVTRTMEERDQALREDWDAARAAEERAANADAEAADALAPARERAAGIIESARSEAEEERASIIANAQAEIDAMRELARSEIETARADAMSGVGSQVADLTAQATSKVINKPVDSTAARSAVDRVMAQREA